MPKLRGNKGHGKNGINMDFTTLTILGGLVVLGGCATIVLVIAVIFSILIRAIKRK
jgi:hypothetical protein